MVDELGLTEGDAAVGRDEILEDKGHGVAGALDLHDRGAAGVPGEGEGER